MNNTEQTWLVEERFRQQLDVMLQMQTSMNGMVFPDWADRGLAWHRAIYVEAAEDLEHLATWKWWKKGTPDLPQANMELVDIWHFGLSWYIQRFGQPVGSEALNSGILRRVRASVSELPSVVDETTITNEMRHAEVNRLVQSAGDQLFNTGAFVKLLAYGGMNFESLFLRYVGKNMLNRFRQENGYRLGTYVKVWAGEEDNVHLDAILNEAVDVLASELPAVVYAKLSARYTQLVRAA